jgi:hypothetical protein
VWPLQRESELDTPINNRAADRYSAAVDELNETGVHVNNKRKFPVFSLGVKESAYDPPSRVEGAAPFLDLAEAVRGAACIDQRG